MFLEEEALGDISRDERPENLEGRSECLLEVDKFECGALCSGDPYSQK